MKVKGLVFVLSEAWGWATCALVGFVVAATLIALPDLNPGHSFDDLLVSSAVDIQKPEEAPSKALNLVEEADVFYVNIELIVFREEIDQYPTTWESVRKAIAEWSSHVPVRFTIYSEGSIVFSDRPGVIKLHLTDLQVRYGFPERLLGLWLAREDTVLLDADSLEQVPERAYSVALHELGHLFGVSHVVGELELGITGYIVLPVGMDPTNYVMYPRSVQGKQQKTLSDVEIRLARHNLIYYWTRPGRGTRTDKDCSLF